MPRPPNIPNRKILSQVRSAPIQNQIALLIEQGLAFHRQGKFNEAQALYESILKIQVNHFDALQLLGAIFTQTKQSIKAIEILTKALQINPNYAASYSNRGIALQDLRRYDEALLSYDKAISINPNYAEAYSNRGNTLKELQRYDEALLSYDQAISIKPEFVDAHSNRGVILKELQRYDEALLSCDQAISINPNYAAAYSNRGNALKELQRHDEALLSYDQAISINPSYAEAYYNRGIALYEIQRYDEALLSYDRAISIKPGFADAYSDRGNALRELQRYDEALLSYDQAISIKPEFAEAYSNRGATLQVLRRYDEVILSCDQAISINPNYAEAYSNRGIALYELQRYDEALLSYHNAISIKSDYAGAYWNLALCHLLLGNFKDGWQGYEWRWKNKSIESFKSNRSFPQPLWLGAESLAEKTILLHAEQGLGDTIQFCRYIPLVAQLGANVVLEVQRPLLKLLKGLEGVSQIVAVGDVLPAFDYQCPLLSLPLAFKTELHTIPPIAQHIISDTDKVTKWQTKLGEKTKPRVGLVWSGSAEHKNDHNRSLSLSQLLSHLPSNIEYVCLQKEIRAIDKELLAQHTQIKYFGDALEDFTDTAALCELVDLVISVDTSVAHLAGTLGKPAWVLVTLTPDWRWLLDRDDSPWYPSVKVYRQDKANDWNGVLDRTRSDLEKRFDLSK